MGSYGTPFGAHNDDGGTPGRYDASHTHNPPPASSEFTQRTQGANFGHQRQPRWSHLIPPPRASLSHPGWDVRV
eukprot:scaffold1523_cov426-Prasinococcus_capsulatus_cf.AAC.10